MKKAACLVMVLLVCLAPLAFGQRREVGEDNPFRTPTVDLWTLVIKYRSFFKIDRIVISKSNPFDMRYAHFLWFLGYPTNALQQFYEALRSKDITTLSDLLSISYLGGETRLLRLLLLFSFEDEEVVTKKIRIELPSWWPIYGPK